ncbi:hypothetical protein SEA_ELESAR_2 [Arthrobacter phage Elesar]|uniref:Uncharacterized protein n=1 Tax=Arthrobacter phage Elesar TaxID=2510522 RepID=A0A411CQ52_9CAUD|nr:hypothetical protein QEO79_gp02 [Arthrobacter phage Elesar]QAY16054.1 hypothetical protein SEA_ELESAR_2 [Arthrobacter phage Elesar]
MHSEHITRAIEAAVFGSKVAVFADSLEQAQDLARNFEDAVPVSLQEALEYVSRANGRCRLDFCTGGSIRFMSLRQSGRGMVLDRVFLPITTDKNTLCEILPSLMTSHEGVLTGY